MIGKKRGVAFLGFILLSVISVTAGANAPTNLCELSASNKATLLSRLIQLGLEHGALRIEDVQLFVDGAEWTNPYERVPRTERTLSFRNSFTNFSRTASPADKALVKKATASLLLNAKQNSVIVRRAKTTTEQILAPRLLGEVEVPVNLKPGADAYSAGWLEGRPIFVGRMRYVSTQRNQIAVFDPFNSLKDKRIEIVKARSALIERNSDFGFFMMDSIPYAVDYKQNLNVDLRELRDVTAERFSNPPRDEDLEVAGHLMIQTDRGPKIIAATHGGKFADKLMEFDALNREKPRVLARNVSVDKREPKSFSALGKTYVTYSTMSKAYIYDASTGTIIDRFRINGSEDEENHLVVYSDREKTKIAYFEMSSDSSKYVLRLRDLAGRKKSKVIYENEESYDLNVVELDGVDYLYFFNSSNLVMVNTSTQKVEVHKLTRRNSPSASDWGFTTLMTWKNQKYLLWGTSEGELKIFDFGSRSLIFDKEITVDGIRPCFYYFSTIQYQGHLYAVGTALSQAPLFFQLTHGGGVEGEP